MLRLIVGTMLCASALSASLLNLDQEWIQYKKYHSKQYEAVEDSVRRVIWEQNLQYVEQHNLAADRGVHTFRLGMNKFADMTNREFVQLVNGYKMAANRTAGSTYLPPSNAGDLPSSVDWRTKGYVTPVKNQGGCGSCWAFSTTGSLEGQHFKKTGKLVSLSEQNLVDCSGPEGNQGCDGGLMDKAFLYVKKNHGLDTEASYPYQGTDGKCKFSASTVGATDTGFVDVKKGSEADLQSAVATVGPVSVAIDAGCLSFQLYQSGVYYEPECSPEDLDHGVLVVGYGSTGGKDYWTVKNSWGESWGMNGYILMSRNRNNNCGIASKASYPLV